MQTSTQPRHFGTHSNQGQNCTCTERIIVEGDQFVAAQMTFGGVKASRVGRFGGLWGIHEFTVLRGIPIQEGNFHAPI